MQRLSRDHLERLIFQSAAGQRYTQDSPVLPDVWIDYGLDPGCQLDLLVTPQNRSASGELSAVLRKEIGDERKIRGRVWGSDAERAHHGIAYTRGHVVARLYFDELVRVVLPMTQWWHDNVWRLAGPGWDEQERFDLNHLQSERGQRHLVDAIEAFDQGLDTRNKYYVTPEAIWMLRIVGSLAWALRQPAPDEPAWDDSDPEAGAEPLLDPETLVAEVAALLADFQEREAASEQIVWQVNKNRPSQSAMQKSVLAVKGDAARQLFSVDSQGIAWGVVDSGIDARHLAFRRRDSDGSPLPDPFADPKGRRRNNTRVVATYDFTEVRTLLDPVLLADESKLPKRLRDRLDPPDLETLAPPEVDAVNEDRAALRASIAGLKAHLEAGRQLDWGLLAPLLEVPHDPRNYRAPTHQHGTHVAGILAGDWPEEGMVGVCPELDVYDLRVLGDAGGGDEFSVISAVQYVRHLSGSRDELAVHGVNLSLSLKHDIANYACGETPICRECTRLIGAGIVVVAAAGNLGYLKTRTQRGWHEGYNSISITDPGNAEKVITVGATHRYFPHTYGVSYFSSRGPTGDGRYKPDLVAPGEKITAPIPGSETFDAYTSKDGTSMAAPHVSGAAALLIARHRELAGKPERVKEILCATATDLQRERYFQGHGMLDILRALQSV